jgi:hypothetical protein
MQQTYYNTIDCIDIIYIYIRVIFQSLAKQFPVTADVTKTLVPVGAERSCPLLQCVVELLWIPTKFALDQQIHLRWVKRMCS